MKNSRKLLNEYKDLGHSDQHKENAEYSEAFLDILEQDEKEDEDQDESCGEKHSKKESEEATSRLNEQQSTHMDELLDRFSTQLKRVLSQASNVTELNILAHAVDSVFGKSIYDMTRIELENTLMQFKSVNQAVDSMSGVLEMLLETVADDNEEIEFKMANEVNDAISDMKRIKKLKILNIIDKTFRKFL